MKSAAWCATLLLLACPAGPVAASSDGRWDVGQPRGDKVRRIDFTTTEGTWMSVDLSPNGRSIVFDLLGHIYVVPAKGGRARCLTQASGISLNFHPRYSPDGKEIAFISDRGGQDNLWVMNADGSQPRPVFQDPSARAVEPAWMPDGKRILVTKRLMTSYGFYRVDDAIWIYPRDGGAGRQIVGRNDQTPSAQRFAGNPRYQWPAPSPDGSHVYFNASAFAGDNRRIQRIELATGRIDDVTESKDIYRACCGRPAYPDRLGEIAPQPSPDGKWLAFARKLPGGLTEYRGKEYMGRTALWLRNLASGEERILMDPIEMDAMDGHPVWKLRALPGYAWARDSRSLVLSQGGKIRRIWLDGGRVETIPIDVRVERTLSEMARGRVTIADEAFEARAVRWPAVSPDGSQLAFEAAGRIWLKTLPDGAPRTLTRGPSREIDIERTPAWSPDGRAVVYASAGRDGKGHLWRVALKDGRATRLTDEAGLYAFPVFVDGGKTVAANRWPPALLAFGPTPSWEWIGIPASGGKLAVRRGPGPLVGSTNAVGGRVHFARPSDDFAGSLVVSLGAARSQQTEHLWIAGPVAALALSPDGHRLAFQRSRDIYVVPLPPPAPGGGPLPRIDVAARDNPLPVQRISTGGGFLPHWLDRDRLGYLVADRHYTHDFAQDTRTESTIGLTVPRDRAHGTIALTGARIITMVGNEVIENGSIVVDGSRIRCVGRCTADGADRVIDVNGKTIMPGWVDTHAHHQTSDPHGFIPKQRSDSAVYLAYGVTTTFEPAGTDDAYAIGEMTAAGAILGPRSFTAGPPLTCGWDPRLYSSGLFGGAVDDIPAIEDEGGADNLVRDHALMGAISIKDYKQCTRTQRQMLAHAARRHGVSITTEQGDLPYVLGQIMNGHTGWEHPLEYKPLYRDVVTFVGQAGAHYSADLILSDYPFGNALEYWFGKDDLWLDERVARWLPWQFVAARRSFVRKPRREYGFPILAEAAWDMARAGGLPTIGAHGEMHGLGNHWEAQIMALAAPAHEVLRYATYNGAHFLGLEQELGSLEAGKLADFVVLNSNPLTDIRNTLDSQLVMLGGRLYESATLREIWPEARPYGPQPWLHPDIRRSDKRAVDYWDLHSGE